MSPVEAKRKEQGTLGDLAEAPEERGGKPGRWEGVFDRTGHVRGGFYVLGEPAVPVYLLDGRRPVLFDAGFTCFGELYRKAIQEVLGDRSPEFLFLTHVHYDHCGAVGYLKRSFPGLKVGASSKADEILQRPNALRLMASLNRKVASLPMYPQDRLIHDAFEPFRPDRILSDGERIGLEEGLSIEVLATPGHTWDLLSYYIPERRILIASEALGVMDVTGYVVTEFLVDFDAYVASMRRLASLDVEVLCQGHLFVYTDGTARSFLDRAVHIAEEFKDWVECLLRAENGDIDAVVARIKAEEYDPRPFPKQPESAYLINLRTRVSRLAQRMKA